jgi:predicted TIM-barrel fold metal-dependent hydrolase
MTMKLKYGLISADSHAQLHKDAFTSRMSRARFGDSIPHVIETTDKSMMAEPLEGPVERWVVNGKVVDTRGVTNCPAIMNDPYRTYTPQRWDEIPPSIYDPIARLEILDRDRVDAEVLFPNPPVQNATFFQGDAQLEMACVQAYNDAINEWHRASDRYVPLALVPYLSGVKAAAAEVERVAANGIRGVLMIAEPSNAVKPSGETIFRIASSNPELGALKHFSDPYWDRLWAACEECGASIHWHTSAGIQLRVPMWRDYSRGQMLAAHAPPTFAVLAQFLPNLIFSGILDRYPRLNWVCAETGLGWLGYVLEACDHEWERRHLWTEGVPTRPSELFRRQLYVAVWFEAHGIDSRHEIGVDRIMWETDFPHNTSTYPDSWEAVERVLANVPEAERRPILWENAARLYGLSISQ